MSFITNMYGKRPIQSQSPTTEKNPNRVAGGIRGSGNDTVLVLGEDGVQQELPTQKYVESLRGQIDKQKAVINVLERKLARLEKNVESLSSLARR